MKPAIVKVAPLSRLFPRLLSCAPAAMITAVFKVILLLPEKLAVALFARVNAVLVVKAFRYAKTLPLEIVTPAAFPMPKVVKPKVPPETVSVPVKVLVVAGFRIQTPPSFLITERTDKLVPDALVRTLLN